MTFISSISSFLYRSVSKAVPTAFTLLALGALTLAGTRAAQAQSSLVSYLLDADNDMALYVGNADATIFRQVVDKTTGWSTALSGSFTLNAGEDYFYMVSLNYGGPGDIGGFLNGVSLVDMGNWYSKDVTGQITGFPNTEDPTFTPDTEEIRVLVSTGGFTSASPSIGWGTCSPILGTETFETPYGNSATVYRQSVAAANAAPAAAPEPGTLALLVMGGIGMTGMVARKRYQK
jgi:hypothetical protein